jgi:hypothetical protein
MDPSKLNEAKPAARGWAIDALGEAAFAQLASELGGSELQSLLLEVMQRRAQSREPKALLAQYEGDGYCAPGPVDQRTQLAIDAQLLAAAAAFEAVELSPVAPLGACSAVALTDQKRVLSALRSTEVLSDPTNVFALECARRLRSQPRQSVHLCSSQRVLRAQPIPPLPGYTRHFRMFALGSAGPEAKDHAFSVDALCLHVRSMLAGLERLEPHGYAFGERSVDVLATPERASLGERIAHELGPIAQSKPLEHAYYSGGLRYQIWVTAADGTRLPLIDGGAFDWLQRLAANRRAVFIASGAGSQLIALRFRAHGQCPGGQ